MRLFIWLCFLVLILFPSFAEHVLLVNRVEDLENHFQLHINRVGTLGLELYDERSEVFGSVPRALVAEFLSLHDQTKLNDSAEFRGRFWARPLSGPSFLTRLYGFYHRPPETPERKNELGALKKELNDSDTNVALWFFKKHGLLDAEGKPDARALLLLRIEHIADIVDRARDPVAKEEFSRIGKTLLREYLEDRNDRSLAEELLTKYPKFVGHLGYQRTLCPWRSFVQEPFP